jgi:hypothetical protein
MKNVAKTSLMYGNKKSFSAHRELANFRGIRVAPIQEPEEDDKFDMGIVKSWAACNRITFNLPHREPLYFEPQFKMIFCCNNSLSLPLDDSDIWRRANVIEFKSKFVENPDPKNRYEFKKDIDLKGKLAVWKDAFMYILLEHHKIYKKKGLLEPEQVKNMAGSYKEYLKDKVELKTGDNQNKEYIYLVQVSNKNIYKIGKTRQEQPVQRLRSYTNLDGKLILLFPVNNCTFTEQSIKNQLKNTSGVIQKLNLGQEYFECDLNTIKKVYMDNLKYEGLI